VMERVLREVIGAGTVQDLFDKRVEVIFAVGHANWF